jgi:hypothetical protein
MYFVANKRARCRNDSGRCTANDASCMHHVRTMFTTKTFAIFEKKANVFVANIILTWCIHMLAFFREYSATVGDLLRQAGIYCLLIYLATLVFAKCCNVYVRILYNI